MKILFLTSRFPFPLEKGDKLRAYHQIKELSKFHEVHLVSVVDELVPTEYLDILSEITKSINILSITPFERWFSILQNSVKGLPYQVAWFYSKPILAEILRICKTIEPDHVYCQLCRMAEYARQIDIPKTLDYMDSFGISMMKRSKISGFLTSWIYRMEGKRMIKYEEKIAHYFDNLIIISNQDKNNLHFSNASNIQVIGNGVGEYFTEYREDHPVTHQLVYVGNMSYLPNIETANYIVNNILPLCPEHYTVLLAGDNPDRRVKELASDNVILTGWVDDIRPCYLSGKLFIVPMWSGTGQQNKILEALALGVPCITTTMVNNAIGAIPNHEIIIAETKEEFVLAIQLLMSDEDLYLKIKENGRRFVKEKFDWIQKGWLLSSTFVAKNSNN